MTQSHKERNDKFRANNPLHGSMYIMAQRQQALRILGNVCVKCGFSDWRALQIDHVEGGGSQERKEKSPSVLYREIIQGIADLSKYQILCANCNYIKRYEEGEVGEGRTPNIYQLLKALEDLRKK